MTNDQELKHAIIEASVNSHNARIEAIKELEIGIKEDALKSIDMLRGEALKNVRESYDQELEHERELYSNITKTVREILGVPEEQEYATDTKPKTEYKGIMKYLKFWRLFKRGD